jgi:hypothetical protein
MRVSQQQHCVGKDEYEQESLTSFIESGGRGLQPDNIHWIRWLIQARALLAPMSKTAITQANPGHSNVHPYTSISTQHAVAQSFASLAAYLSLQCA